MAAGRVTELLDEAWRLLQVTMFLEWSEVGSFSEAELDVLNTDALKAKSVQQAVLQLKTDYWKRAPWSFAVLGHPDENVARAGGIQIRADFQRDPRPPPVQHRSTWTLMKEGAHFGAQLDLFIAGTPRGECSPLFQERVALWALMPVVETTIEEKHARASLENKRHHIGPVRVSLANRGPLLERNLARDPSSLVGLLQSFEETRQLAELPALVDLEAHPDLLELRHSIQVETGKCYAPKTSQLLPVLSSIVYHCDLPGSHRSLQDAKKYNGKAKAQQT